MHRITLILILFLFLPDIYIYFVHLVRKTKHRWLLWVYWVPTLLLAAAYVHYLYLGGANALSHNAQAIGILAILTLLLAAPKTLFMLCSLVGMGVRLVFRRCPTTPFTLVGLVLALVSFGNILYGSTEGIRHFQVKEVTYESARLPQGFDGYRIVQLSDIHIGSWKDRETDIERMVNLTNAQEADLIVFTGDLVNQQSHELDGFASILSRLQAPDGVYSILGNHDYGTYYRWANAKEETDNLQRLKDLQQDMGWRLLNNDHTILHHRGDSIALIGVENDGEPPFSQHADLAHATRNTHGMFSILLSHNPTHWRRQVLPESDIDLMLSGHTHAMQMSLFGRSLASLKYPEWSGFYYEGTRALYVNVGIGYVGLPFRFGAWPEITVITLRCTK